MSASKFTYTGEGSYDTTFYNGGMRNADGYKSQAADRWVNNARKADGSGLNNAPAYPYGWEKSTFTTPIAGPVNATKTMSKQTKVVSIVIVKAIDYDADLSFLDQFEDAPKGSEERKYHKQNQKRKATYGDTWDMVGVYVKAEVKLPSGTIQTLKSGGLWGIESDSDTRYFSEVALEEYVVLREDLLALGISNEELGPLWAAALDSNFEYVA